MVAKAEAKFIRISPFRARMVMALIKGFNAQKAVAVLASLDQKAAFLLAKVLKSAMANAKQKGYDPDKLYISRMAANPGPMLKRFRAATFGRATGILKRLSHLVVEVDTTEKIVSASKAAVKSAKGK